MAHMKSCAQEQALDASSPGLRTFEGMGFGVEGLGLRMLRLGSLVVRRMHSERYGVILIVIQCMCISRDMVCACA